MKTIKVTNGDSVAAAGGGQGALCAEIGNGRCKGPELGRWDAPCLKDRKPNTWSSQNEGRRFESSKTLGRLMQGDYEQIKVYEAPSSGQVGNTPNQPGRRSAAYALVEAESTRGRWTNSGRSNRTCGRLDVCVGKQGQRETYLGLVTRKWGKLIVLEY